MIIEDPDAFKTWLTAVLKPICVADPEALAKYVIALVKKDKSPDALQTSMVNQLQVFLQDETEPFVDQLFTTLNNQAYLESVAVPNANPPNPAVTMPASAVLIKAELPTKAALNKPVIPVAEIAALSETLNGKAEKDKRDARLDKEMKDRDREKEEKGVVGGGRRRIRRRSNSRVRSRSRSWDRGRRSRSREKDKRDRVERGDRRWRAKSPYYRAPRGYRNRSPPRSRSLSRSRSRSPDAAGAVTGANVGEEEGKAPPVQAPPVQAAPAGVDGRKRRCRDYDEEGYCMRGGMCPYDHGVDAVVLEDSALSRVLYPNGAGAGTGGGAGGGGVGDGILGPAPAGHMMPRPVEYNPQAPQMWHQRGPGGPGGGGGGFRGHRGGLNHPPRARMPMGPFQGGGPPTLPNMQRELISVPVLGTDAPPMEKYAFGGGPHMNVGYAPDGLPGGGGGGFPKKKQFDFNRLGARAKNPANCSLELKKVPPGLNNITHLNNHFVKFGKIVNIQVCFEGDPEAAIVTFSSHAEANAAYRSTEAVLNNRFIKVFWHSGGSGGGDKDAPPMGVPPPQPRSIKERLGQGGNVPPNANKFLHVAHAQEKENTAHPADVLEEDKEAVAQREERARAAAVRLEELKAVAAKQKQELLAAKERLKKNQEEKRKEALKLTQDLRKRKQDLLEKQIAHQKLLIEKMSKSPPGPQRDLLMQTIKKTQESIEVIRKDIAQAVLAMKAATVGGGALPPKRSKEAVQKELLDAELDLIAKQAEGVDTTELQKKFWELKAKAAGAPPAPASGGGPVAGITRGRGRGRRFNPLGRHKLVKNNLTDGQAVKAHAVDHRPTRLLVSGYEADEHAAVLAHFRHFGEIVECESDEAVPSIVVSYRTRKEAEHALAKGRHFADRTLSVTWAVPPRAVLPANTRASILGESDDDEELLDGDADEDAIGTEVDFAEDVLLQDDEEEEEENEDRSWRR